MGSRAGRPSRVFPFANRLSHDEAAELRRAFSAASVPAPELELVRLRARLVEVSFPPAQRSDCLKVIGYLSLAALNESMIDSNYE